MLQSACWPESTEDQSGPTGSEAVARVANALGEP
jgi:hypothetical protein